MHGDETNSSEPFEDGWDAILNMSGDEVDRMLHRAADATFDVLMAQHATPSGM